MFLNVMTRPTVLLPEILMNKRIWFTRQTVLTVRHWKASSATSSHGLTGFNIKSRATDCLIVKYS